jgi:hypothetical protein
MKTSHPALRIFALTAIALFICVQNLPDLVRVAGYPNGEVGFRTDGQIVTTVLPRTPASDAGMRAGDRIDLSALSPSDRADVLSGFLPSPGDAIVVRTSRAGRSRVARLRAIPEKTVAAFIIIREAIFLIPLLIGIFLVLRRPSPITWGFFLFSLTASGFPPSSVFGPRFLPDWTWQTINSDFFQFADYVLPKAGLTLFAFGLARRPLNLWPMTAIIATAVIGFIEVLPTFYFPDTANLGWAKLNAAGDIIAAILALCGLFYAYSHVAIRLRQRLHWIAAGFVLWLVIDVIDAMLWPTYESYAMHTALTAVRLLFPLVVAYAIFRERVVDINFVISRSLVYGVLTTSIVGIFALIDLFFSRTMESRFSLPVEIVVALLLGLFFHGIRRRIDALVDRVVFRKRHLAETALARTAKAVTHVDDPQAIADYLTRLPVEVLGLTGAALYLQRDGRFVLERCVGWKNETPATLPASDPLVAFISSELGCVRVNEVPMRESPLDRHDAPALAMPLVFRRELAGFVLYGAHVDGADLDADDERDLLPLVNNAAVTYDHIEAQALREEISELRLLRSAPAGF